MSEALSLTQNAVQVREASHPPDHYVATLECPTIVLLVLARSSVFEPAWPENVLRSWSTIEVCDQRPEPLPRAEYGVGFNEPHGSVGSCGKPLSYIR